MNNSILILINGTGHGTVDLNEWLAEPDVI